MDFPTTASSVLPSATLTVSRVCPDSNATTTSVGPLPTSFACFQGSCSPTGECVCRAGWTHDTSFARFGNCGMPAWWLSFLLGVTSLTSLVALAMLLVAVPTLKGDTKRAAKWASASQLLNAVSALSYYQTGFASGWFWLFQGAAIDCVFALVIVMFGAFFRVASRALSVPLPERRLHVAFVLMAVMGTIPTKAALIGSFILGGGGDPRPFNDLIVYGVFATLPLHELTAVPVFASIPLHLIRIATEITGNVAAHQAAAAANTQSSVSPPGSPLASSTLSISPPGPGNNSLPPTPSTPTMSNKNNNNTASVHDFIKRLRFFHFVMIRLTVPSITGSMFLLVALHASLGQIPFQWLIVMFMLLMHPVMGLAVFFLTVRDPKSLARRFVGRLTPSLASQSSSKNHGGAGNAPGQVQPANVVVAGGSTPASPKKSTGTGSNSRDHHHHLHHGRPASALMQPD